MSRGYKYKPETAKARLHVYTCTGPTDWLLRQETSKSWYTPDIVVPATRNTAETEKLPRFLGDSWNDSVTSEQVGVQGWTDP